MVDACSSLFSFTMLHFFQGELSVLLVSAGGNGTAVDGGVSTQWSTLVIFHDSDLTKTIIVPIHSVQKGGGCKAINLQLQNLNPSSLVPSNITAADGRIVTLLIQGTAMASAINQVGLFISINNRDLTFFLQITTQSPILLDITVDNTMPSTVIARLSLDVIQTRSWNTFFCFDSSSFIWDAGKLLPAMIAAMQVRYGDKEIIYLASILTLW